jgi:hypothetical protein
MKRLRRSRAAVALLAGLVLVLSGAGASSAQEDDHDHPSPPPSTTPTTLTPGPPPSGLRTTEITYGPFDVPGAPMNPDGTHGHAHTGNRFVSGVRKPCTSCYITGMRADLRYPDGRQADWSNDAQLHHMVLINSSRRDVTCGTGQRFFASGDERTVVPTVGNFGYRVGLFDRWTLLYELANHRDTPKDVVITVTFEWVPRSTADMTELTPVWLDLEQCGDSEVSFPAGSSSRVYTWTANRAGRLMHLHGHVHDGGVNVTVDNASTGRRLCDSRAGYGESPAYIGHHGEPHISSMSICMGNRGAPIDTIRTGNRIRLEAHYTLDAPVDDAMGISILYLAPA